MMDKYQEICIYMDQKPGSYRDFPFGPEVLVFKVGRKIFAILAWEDEPLRLSLKCDPAEALIYRNQYSSIIPGYHLNKQHWNTVICDESICNELLFDMIDHSYKLVIESLPKSERSRLG